MDTQRSIYPVKEIRLLPAREFPLDEAGISRFRENFRDKFEGDPSRSQLYKDVSNGMAPGGVEYYLPLFFETTATLFDYLPPSAMLCLHQDMQAATQNFWRDTQSRFDLLRGDRNRPLLPPQELFLSVDEFFGALKPYPKIEIVISAAPHSHPCATDELPTLTSDRSRSMPSIGVLRAASRSRRVRATLA